ncbi:MAG: pentapeptide repeat-containing protein [Nostoc sp. TH1S01]|nr:pentapeptide repeat-containing protein [Nostoc sp. TH1S01]
MTDPSLGKKKKKVTITASLEGIEKATEALIRLGFDSKANFAKSQLLARNTVTKFFQGEPIQLDSFKRICEALKLSWQAIAGLTAEAQSRQLPTTSYSNPDSARMAEQVQLAHRRLTVIDQQSKKIKAVITLQGDIDSVQNWQIIQSAVKAYPGDTVAITDIKQGSIRLFVEGSPEDIERLVSRIQSGDLKTVAGFPVEDVQILSDSSADESSASEEKWRLVRDIISQPVKKRHLSGADLSDADLSRVNLSYANLRDADLSGANLNHANLNHANLSDANLSDADLSDANLSDANLSDADLSDANLSSAYLFGTNLNSANLSGAYLFGTNLSGAYLSGANLSSANLSGAYLFGTNLSGAYLFGTNLSSAYLFGTNLSGANLFGTNLSGANLSGADLSRADLSRADLSRADLSRAIVANALFGGSIGLTENMKRDLERRGAIFGDRPHVLSPK